MPLSNTYPLSSCYELGCFPQHGYSGQQNNSCPPVAHVLVMDKVLSK